jgi:hypothetical protein
VDAVGKQYSDGQQRIIKNIYVSERIQDGDWNTATDLLTPVIQGL